MIYLELFITFFTIGLFTFGGGYAMLPLIQQKVIDHGWMEMEQLVDFVAISESTPGPFAVNIATYVGAETAMAEFGGNYFMGALGSVCATLGVVLPSFIIILIVAKFYLKFKNSKAVSGVMLRGTTFLRILPGVSISPMIASTPKAFLMFSSVTTAGVSPKTYEPPRERIRDF